MPEATSKKIIRNTIFTSAGRLWGYFLSFLLTPYIVHKIGIERFGIWAIANTAINFFIYFDLGIGSSFVKHIAEYNTKKNYKKINEIINTGLIFSLFFCFCILLVAMLLKNFAMNLLKFSSELYDDVLFAFFGVLMVFIINYVFTVFKSTLYGFQRMDITNIIYIIVSIPGTIGLVLFLSLGFGLKGLIYNSIIVALVTVMSYAICAYRVFPQVAISLRHISMKMFRRLWNFGFKVQVASFSEFINSELDKILLGYLLNVRLVAFYELGSKIAIAASDFPAILLPAIEPASSELDAAKDTRALNNLYTRGTKYIVFLALPLALFVITNASPIMHFWMGKSGYEKSALAIQILTIGYSFFLVNSIGRLMARGMGIPQFEMISALIILGLNILLSITLIILFGFIGALIGTSVSAIVGSLFFMNKFHKHIKRTITSFLREVYLKPVFACIFAIFTSLVIDLLFYSFDFSPSGRRGYLVYLGLKGVVFSGAYLFCILVVKYLDNYDKEVFLSTIKMPLSKLGFIKNK
ncbi:MAG: putative polysaccharide biosynthesis protein [Candidatus Scalindua rubra]|uniref:Putative polysaccharide biosynthesis protein n=1 Tax=Candidatus Scalindua rubra TaxID=1872076 RepID=A0A1E3X7T4_9BACT|nr:MAG: putative polysaccharide biosynthesis protein [Candidatus Scalindua rubra]